METGAVAPVFLPEFISGFARSGEVLF